MGGVDQSLGKAADCGRGLEVVLVFGEIFGHRDQLSSDLVPIYEKGFRRARRGLERRAFFRSFLRACGRGQNSGSKDQYNKQTGFIHGRIPPHCWRLCILQQWAQKKKTIVSSNINVRRGQTHFCVNWSADQPTTTLISVGLACSERVITNV